MKSKVKNDSFVAIYGWMVNDLNLKGNELIVYAIIYSFSQSESKCFNGSLQYLADWAGSTKRGIIKNIKSLVEKKLITKEEETINNIKFCKYCTSRGGEQSSPVLNKVHWGGEQSSLGGGEQSSPNNIDIDNKEYIFKEKRESGNGKNIRKNKNTEKHRDYDKLAGLE